MKPSGEDAVRFADDIRHPAALLLPSAPILAPFGEALLEGALGPTTLRKIDYIPAPPLQRIYHRALLRCIAGKRALPTRQICKSSS